MIEAIESYLSFLKLANKSDNTIRSYRGYLLDFAGAFPSLSPSEIGAQQIEHYIHELARKTVSRTTLRRALATLKSFCAWLVTEGVLDENPTEDFPGPRVPHRVIKRVATKTEIREWLDGPLTESHFPSRDRLLLELLYGSGLRCAEVAAVQVGDFIESDVLLVSKGKGDKQRTVLLTEPTQRALQIYLKQREEILRKRIPKNQPRKCRECGAQRLEKSCPKCGFAEKLGRPNRSGRPMRKVYPGSATLTALFFGVHGGQINGLSSRSVLRIVSNLAMAAGLPWLRTHDLRRAMATHMDQAGAPRIVISRLLGHSRQSITDVYIEKASPERLKAVYDRARRKLA